GHPCGTCGTGVLGVAHAVTGTTTGLRGVSLSPDGRGVVGVATSATGPSVGVMGHAVSADGYAGYFVGRGFFSDNVGIGTDSPVSELDVPGTISISGVPGIDGDGPWIGPPISGTP